MNTLQQIEAAALGLGQAERHALAGRLWDSLEATNGVALHPAWDDEVRGRVMESRSETADLLTLDEVRAHLDELCDEPSD